VGTLGEHTLTELAPKRTSPTPGILMRRFWQRRSFRGPSRRIRTVSNLSGTKRTAIYLRTSTDRQHTENQRPDVEQLVRARGFEVSAVFEEQVSAAAKVRPEYERMMKAAHAGEFGILVVWSLDRLGRSMLGNLQAVLDLDRRGVQVVSVRESWLDSDMGPARQLLLGVMGWVAEQERARIGERVRAGLDRVKKKGVKLGRPKAHLNVSFAIGLRHQGKSIREVAKTMGVSTSVVHRALAAFQNPVAVEAVQGLGSA